MHAVIGLWLPFARVQTHKWSQMTSRMVGNQVPAPIENHQTSSDTLDSLEQTQLLISFKNGIFQIILHRSVSILTSTV